MTDGDLPSFRNPPVTEVVVGVAFRDANKLTAAHLGELWHERWQERFPGVEEHPSYFPPVERLDVPVIAPSISFEFGDIPGSRLWFVADDGQELIQVQREWFACNWRKVQPGSTYDRWPSRRSAFGQHFSEFSEFVIEHGLGKVTPIQCEVSYINHIRPGEAWQSFGQLGSVFKLAGQWERGFLPEPEQMQVGATFILRDGNDQPIGRLHVTAQPASLRDDGTQIYLLNLTARGAPRGEGLSGALAFLDLAREAIVRGFIELTTEPMHREWGRYA